MTWWILAIALSANAVFANQPAITFPKVASGEEVVAQFKAALEQQMVRPLLQRDNRGFDALTGVSMQVLMDQVKSAVGQSQFYTGGYIGDAQGERLGGSSLCRFKKIALSLVPWSEQGAQPVHPILAMHEGLVVAGYAAYDRRYQLSLVLWWLKENPRILLNEEDAAFLREFLPILRQDCHNTWSGKIAGITVGGDGGDLHSLWAKWLTFTKAKAWLIYEQSRSSRRELHLARLYRQILLTPFEPAHHLDGGAILTPLTYGMVNPSNNSRVSVKTVWVSNLSWQIARVTGTQEAAVDSLFAVFAGEIK